jgi:beta-galactosidase
MPCKRFSLTAVLCAALLATVAGMPAQAAAEPVPVAHERLWMGAAWYPEQWPEARWDRDLALMQQAGFNVVRIGEFAWSRMEPSEGHFDFGWLDTAIRKAGEHGIKVVIGTPTDTPPAWLTSRYPDTLRVDADGKTMEHGGRRQFSNSSPRYREFCRKIAEALASRYGHNDNVVGWQIGNEYTEESFDAATKKQFQDWLKARYHTLDALNAAWTTTYWSQSYSAWEQIPMNALAGNPGLMLDRKRFVTTTWVDFQKVQSDALRAHADPRQFVTTNLGGLGWADRFDRYAVSRDLDLISWDDYVGSGHLDVARNAATHDLVRGWKRQNFWVMETQPGTVNWAPVNNPLYRGETRAMAWQAVGHGADAVLYWQWRGALNGQEQYHGSLVGADGEPLPVYGEIQRIGKDFAVAGKALAGTSPRADVAILQSYDSRWAIDFQPFQRNYDQIAVLLDYYRPLVRRGHTVDIVQADAPLAGYKVVFAPSLNVIDEPLARHLADYVRAGGHLVLGPRSGMKDAFNRLNVQRQPGPLAETLGGRVAEFYALDETVPVSGEAGNGTASIWGEQLEARAKDTRVLLRFGSGEQYYSGEPAAIERKLGGGAIAYLGALLDPALMQSFVDRQLDEAGAKASLPPVPEGVEVMRRHGADHDVLIFINHGKAAADVKLPTSMSDLLDHDRSLRSLRLAPQDVAVLRAPVVP